MPVGEIKAAAKRKIKDKAVKTVTRKVSGGGRGGGKNSGKKKSPILIIVVLLIVVGAAIAAWQFGLFDSLLNMGDTEPSVTRADVDGSIEIHFIDVGQADATFIVTEAGTMLIDAGSRRSGPRVVEYLQEMGITEITYVVATHPHEDHIGGMDLILNGFTVGHVLLPDISHTTRTYERMVEAIETHNISTSAPLAGHTFEMGDVAFTVIHPSTNNNGRNLNNWSLSLRVDFGNVSMITTGDAEVPAEREMIATGINLQADILRLGHHGSRTSTAQEFLDAVNPSIAIIQVGEDNDYGHPHSEVMDRLYEAGLRIYRNDHHGNIVLTTDGTSIDIRTERAG